MNGFSSIPAGEFVIYGSVLLQLSLSLISYSSNWPQFTVPLLQADEVALKIKEITKLAQSEEGTLHYCISADTIERNRFHLFERYESKAAFEQHMNQALVKELFTGGLLSDVKLNFLKPLLPADARFG
jgi:quinol monooxygenase YgiN